MLLKIPQQGGHLILYMCVFVYFLLLQRYLWILFYTLETTCIPIDSNIQVVLKVYQLNLLSNFDSFHQHFIVITNLKIPVLKTGLVTLIWMRNRPFFIFFKFYFQNVSHSRSPFTPIFLSIFIQPPLLCNIPQFSL